jgi:CubicO group peptidase (beta-lactamase class C family)
MTATPSADVAPEISATLALLVAGIEGDIAARAAPGISLAVVGDGRTLLSRGFGMADLARGIPATADTVYAVGSITKLFTATMLMRLRDAGKLRLDDPVQDHLPEVPVPRRHDGAPPITLRHLVTHTSGLTKDAPAGYWAGGEFPSIAAVLALLPETGQPYPPATRWKYSNLGIALLGHALERVAGEPWESYVAREILLPLGMDATAPRFAERQRDRLATGYARPVAGWPPAVLRQADLGGISYGGSMHATVADMARFALDQLSPAPRVLSRSSVLEMQRLQWLNDDWRSGQGIGWRIHRAGDGGTRIEHGGGVFGFTCKLLMSPADGLGVVVFTNGSDGNVGIGWAARALDLLAPVFRARAQRTSAVTDVPTLWQSYVGRYRWVLGDMEIFVRGGELLMLAPAPPGVEEVRLVPEGEACFRMLGGSVHGETLRFVADPDGRICRAWVGPHPHDRL